MSEGRNDNDSVIDSSGDVFADLGISLDRDDELKLAMAREISRIIDREGLTQVQVAKILKTDQAKVSNIVRGRLKGFGVERLFSYMLELGYDIEVRLSAHRSRNRGRVTVHPMAACG
jgi:predicted XRE-type DNA-binding protein